MNLLEGIFLSSHKLLISFVGILGLSFLIGLHELGHFLFCKLFRVRTPSFSIGFGPHLISKKIGDTEFSLSAIPIGGYVEIAGMAEVGQGKQKEAYRSDKYSFATKPYYQKLLIMSGGILFNILFTYFVLCLLFALGLPKTEMLYPINAKPVIETVTEGSAAEKAGLQTGDRILKINQIDVHENVEGLIKEIQAYPKQTVHLLIERDGQKQTKPVLLEKKEGNREDIGSLGVIFAMGLPAYPVITSIKKGIQLTNRFIYNIFFTFKNLFIQRDVSQVGGPLTIIVATAKGATQGYKTFLFLLAIISINLAILNLIPIPIFDGGQILLYTFEAILGRSLPVKIREWIHIISWILVMLLLLYFTGKDLIRLLSPLKWFKR